MGKASEARLTPGILPFALRANLRLFQFAPGELVNIDVQTCDDCGGAVKIIAAIEDPTAIRKILDHLEDHGAMPQAYHRPAVRGPPRQQRLPHLKG